MSKSMLWLAAMMISVISVSCPWRFWCMAVLMMFCGVSVSLMSSTVFGVGFCLASVMELRISPMIVVWWSAPA